MENGKIKETLEIADESISLYTKHLEYLRMVIGWTKDAKDILQNISPHVDYTNIDQMISMYSFNSLLTVALLDLLVICKKLITASSEWEKVFFIRQGYLTIYETIDTYNSHNAKIKTLIEKKFARLKNDYLAIAARLKQFKIDFSYQDTIKNVRNIAGGHIDKDFVIYYDTLLKLQGENESNAILAFIALLKEIEGLSHSMERISQEHIAEQLEKEGIGKTINDMSLNLDKKLDVLKMLVAKNSAAIKAQLGGDKDVETNK